MIPAFPRLLGLSIVAFSIAACGAAATLPPEDQTGSLWARLSEAVWYAENGDHPNLAFAVDRSILVVPPGDDSTYVNGAFSIDVPDQDEVLFRAQAALSAAGDQPILFRVFAQHGAQFPLLGEVVARGGTPVKDFQIDLTPFRGRSVLLILAISSTDGSPISSSAIWVDPQVVTP